jgi:fructose 1,6-bisphosphate aldolase/phosphatase
MITLSVIKADIGGYVGHSSSHPLVIEKANERLDKAKCDKLLVDFHVTRCGDDLQLIMTHERGEEMEFEERGSEPIVIFMADKTSAGAWNLPLYKIFADPFNTIGLVIAENLHSGFRFEIHDVKEHKKINLDAPEEIYDMLLFMGAPSRYAVKAVYHRGSNEIASVSSTQRLSLMAGRYVGKDDPVCIVRSQGNFPAVGEVLEPFTNPILVEGWMRGSHHGPLMPTSIEQSNPSRFDGPPRICSTTPASIKQGGRQTMSRIICVATDLSSPTGCPWRRWNILLCLR